MQAQAQFDEIEVDDPAAESLAGSPEPWSRQPGSSHEGPSAPDQRAATGTTSPSKRGRASQEPSRSAQREASSDSQRQVRSSLAHSVPPVVWAAHSQ